MNAACLRKLKGLGVSTAVVFAACRPLRNDFNEAQLVCGVEDWSEYEGKIPFRLRGPDGGPLKQELMGRLVFRDQTSNAEEELKLSPAGCFALKEGRAGVLEATVPSRSWGLAIPLTVSGSRAAITEFRLQEVERSGVALSCPKKRTVASAESLLVPFVAQGPLKGSRFFLEITNSESQEKVDLSAEPDGDGALVPHWTGGVKPDLEDGHYTVVARTIDLLNRTSSSKPCTLELDSRVPDAPKSLSAARVVEAASTFELVAPAGSRAFVCFSPEYGGTECSDPERFEEFRRFVRLPAPGRWTAHVFSESGSGLRSPMMRWHLAGDAESPQIAVDLNNPELRMTPSLVQSEETEFSVSVKLSDDTASEDDLRAALECRVEIASDFGGAVKKGNAVCTSPKCKGQKLDDWVKCGSPLTFKLRDAKSVWDSSISLHVRTSDAVGRTARNRVSTWLSRSVVYPWNVGEGDAGRFEVGLVDGITAVPGYEKELILEGFERIFHLRSERRYGSPNSIALAPLPGLLLGRDTNSWSVLFVDRTERVWLIQQGLQPGRVGFVSLGETSGNFVLTRTTHFIPGEADFWEPSPGRVLLYYRDVESQHEQIEEYDHASNSWIKLSLPASRMRPSSANPSVPWLVAENGDVYGLEDGGGWKKFEHDFEGERILGVLALKDWDSRKTVWIADGSKLTRCGFEPFRFICRAGETVPYAGRGKTLKGVAEITTPDGKHALFDGERSYLIPEEPEGAVKDFYGAGGRAVLGFADFSLRVLRQEKWFHIPSFPPVKGLPSQAFQYNWEGITALGEDGLGRLWVGGRGGVARYDGCHWARMPEVPNVGDDTLQVVPSAHASGRVYVVDENEFAAFFDARGWQLVHERSSLVKDANRSDRRIFEDAEGRLCVPGAMNTEWKWLNPADEAPLWQGCSTERPEGEVEASLPLCGAVCSVPADRGAIPVRTEGIASADGSIWRVGNEGVVRKLSGTGREETIPFPPPAGSRRLVGVEPTLAPNDKGEVFLLFSDGVVYQLLQSAKWSALTKPIPEPLHNDGIRLQVWEGPWVLQDGKVLVWEGQEWRSIPIEGSRGSAVRIWRDDAGRVWRIDPGTVAVLNPSCQTMWGPY